MLATDPCMDAWALLGASWPGTLLLTSQPPSPPLATSLRSIRVGEPHSGADADNSPPQAPTSPACFIQKLWRVLGGRGEGSLRIWSACLHLSSCSGHLLASVLRGGCSPHLPGFTCSPLTEFAPLSLHHPQIPIPATSPLQRGTPTASSSLAPVQSPLSPEASPCALQPPPHQAGPSDLLPAPPALLHHRFFYRYSVKHRISSLGTAITPQILTRLTTKFNLRSEVSSLHLLLALATSKHQFIYFPSPAGMSAMGEQGWSLADSHTDIPFRLVG